MIEESEKLRKWTLGVNPASPPTCFVFLKDFLNLSVPNFPHLHTVDNASVYLTSDYKNAFN